MRISRQPVLPFRLLSLLCLALILGLLSARADWPNTNATKFVQLPDRSSNGMDIHFGDYPTILADDFVCTNTGPITDMHLWVSSILNAPATGAQIELSIWEDVPAAPGAPSHPGKRIWREVFNPGEYQIVLAASGLYEEFWKLDPPPPQFLGYETNLFLYNFYPKLPYIQTGSVTAPIIYWLGVSFENNQPPQGWKTSTNHLGPDFAVLGHYNAANDVTDWRTLFDPRNPNLGLDFAFALTTLKSTNPPPVQCIETNGVKYLQPPKVDGGYDVWDNGPWVLADDFICTNTGPITDIHLWGSWLQDRVSSNLTFWIGIYDDVPAVTNGTVYIPSRPGTNLLWEQWFGPGEYSQQPWGVGAEYFLNPGPPAIMGPDSQAHYFCFYPTNPFVQVGSLTQPRIYWLAVHAQSPFPTAEPFGWKSTFNPRTDISVYTDWPGTAPITTAWDPTYDPAGVPLDLAFKLTTSTNEPPPLDCIENRVKYVQVPKVDGGYDVWDNGPWVLADDFLCAETGPVTDIHIWGSYLENRVTTNLTFWIGIYDDVPAVTNGPVYLPSRPGTNLLWEQWFNPGEYFQRLWGTGIEYFLDPGPPAIIGADTEAYYYCFYPKNPFVQLGTPNQPRIYWLAVYAKSPVGTGEQFGWKTTFNPRFDISVHTPWPGAAPITTAWIPTHDPNNVPLDLAFKITTSTNEPPPVCVEHTVKYVQFPDRDQGYDVWDNGPYVLADDFLCTNTGPVTDIHLWGSWLYDRPITNLSFWIGIYDDVPATPTSPSHPGALKWDQWFGPGQYIAAQDGTGIEQFLNPGPPSIMGPDSNVWYYCFYPTNAFVQEGTAAAPRIYWLVVHAVSPTGVNELFGWKTTRERRFDISVHGPWPGGPPPAGFPWTPTRDVFGRELDLAFKITTSTNPPPPVCVEHEVKYVQFPDRDQGYDVWDNGPYVLADDFLCTNRGPVTDIHLWGSWLYDRSITNLSFWIGIYDDVPATPTSPSHPGALKWNQWFGPGQYIATQDGTGFERFLDPGPPSILGPDSNVWYYCFYPTNAFVQEGTATAPKIYWLVVHADSPAGANELFGWKTTTGRRFDISVHGPWPGGPPPAAFPWTPTYDVLGRELDLAFKITTRTSDCPFTVECPTNKVVDCGAAWTFDLPKVISPCCGTNYTITVAGTVTNGLCPQVITRTWVIVDCLTNTATCAQTVTVVSTQPTVVICPTNKVVECGTSWGPDPPVVVPSPCCGTNYNVWLIGSVTNGGFCDYAVSYAWLVVDCCSQTNVCSQVVTVKDTQPPVVNCPPAKTIECGKTWAFDVPTAVDVCCGTNVTVTTISTVTNGVCPVVITRTWAIADCCTNRVACTQEIRVADTTPPVVVCPTNMVVKTCGTNVLVNWTNSAYDLCGGVTVDSTPPPGSYFLPNTTNVVVVTAKDDCGNTNICTFTITVVRPVLGPISYSLSGTTLTLSWIDGILQEAPTVIGPWTDVAGASPPTYSTPVLGPMKFYRLRCNAP